MGEALPALRARRRDIWRRALAMATVAALVAACAYSPRPGRLRPGVERVAVPYFTNESSEPNVEVTLTENIIKGLIDDRTLRVVQEPQADAVVQGTVRSYQLAEVFHGPDRQADEYEVRLTVSVTLANRASGEPIVGPKELRASATYRIADGQVGESNARTQAAQQIVQGILNLVIEEW
jgi:hypothetical protein